MSQAVILGPQIEDSKNLTKQELLMLEARKKSTLEKVWDKVKLVLPILVGVLALLEYWYIPNAEENYVLTNYYPVLIMALTGLYTVFYLLSFANQTIYEKILHKAPFYAFIGILFIVYDLLTLKTRTLAMPYFPWVDRILYSAATDWELLLESTQSSLKLLFTGYFMGAVTGLFTGIICGYSEKANYWIAPFLKVLGPIPTTTWIPVVMVLAASLFQGAVFIIGLGVWFSVTLATITGISNVNRSLYDAGRTLGATSTQMVYRIAIPYALPNIFQGLTSGMSVACTALLVAEMLGVDSGLGWYINWQKSWAEFSKMYAAIVVICITFILVNWLLSLIKAYVLRWQKGMVK